jgi:hypothetical protein
MKTLALSLALLAAAGPALADGGNPPPALLAKIQIATQAYQNQLRAVNAPPADAREYKDMQKFVRESEQASDGGQQLQFEIQMQTSDLQNAESVRSAKGTAIGGAIGGHANDGDEQE